MDLKSWAELFMVPRHNSILASARAGCAAQPAAKVTLKKPRAPEGS
jgi:hypothetical protein